MSRFDAVGLWWQDFPIERRGARPVHREPPPVPETGWTPPREFPNLEAAKVIALDCETKDPDLPERGPGFPRGEAHVVGLAVGTEDGHRWYLPMRHEYEPEKHLNFDPDQVLAWARDHLTRPRQPKVGANLLYDLEALAWEGVPVTGPFHDVQYAQPLLSEDRTYSLEAIARTHLGEGKVDEALYEWLHAAYGGPKGRRQAANIWRAPITMTGPYAEGDVDLPLRILRRQRPLLEAEGLWDLYRLECRLIPLLLAMRLRGVPVDVERAEQVRDRLVSLEENAQETLNRLAGFSVNVGVNDHLARLYDRAGIEYARTAAGNPSFPAQWLKAQTDPVSSAVLAVRKYAKARNPFVEGYILGNHHRGRVYGQFHPLRSDDYGAVSGRFSSSNPNLQNIPSRDEEIAPLIRSLFIPEPGCRWRKFDWSQIEFRLLVHFGLGPTARRAQQMYVADPDTDFHRSTQQWVLDLTGADLGRKPTKNINFGLVYGMGIPKLAASLGMPRERVEELFAFYHEAMPFVKDTFDTAAKRAMTRGYVMTLLGRRARFDQWESRRYENRGHTEATYEAAVERWGPAVQRAFAHKALNRILQGSAADVMKRAMVDIWEAGIFDTVGAPYMVVHDEFDNNDAGTPETEEAFTEMKRIMEECVTLRIPLRADVETGPNWGEVE